ncbi:serine arginine-rich splicing factor [Linnemannia zychae]|nr:serine arginine-rich splicing factor [Linnemannia zychae]
MPTRVYLGHLSRDTSDRDIERLFKNYGNISGVKLKNGYAFVEFDNARDADDVVHDFHGKDFLGERLVVEIARGERARRNDDRYGPPERTDHRLIVENLAYGVSWQDIKDMMRKAGEVTYADLCKGQENQGVVEFQTEEDVQKALKTLDGEMLKGKPITLRLFDASRDTVPRASNDRGNERDRGDRYNRDHGYNRDRGYERDRRDRDRRRSRSRSRDHRDNGAGRHYRDRERNREYERERDRERGRDKDRVGRGARHARSPAPRSRSPVGRHGRSRD